MVDKDLTDFTDYEAGFYDGEHDSDYVKLLEAFIGHLTGLDVRYNPKDLEHIKNIMFPDVKEGT